MVACGFSLAFLTAVVTEGGGVSPLSEGRTGSWGTRLHLWARGGRAAGARGYTLWRGEDGQLGVAHF